jgi:linearmycin/streptolysin S transport system permease protein
MRTSGAAATIAAKDLHQRWRDRSAVLAGVVAPLVLSVLFWLAFGRSNLEFSATYAVADLDGGPIASAFVDGVLRSPDLAGIVTVQPAATRDDALRLARDGDVAASFVIPAGFSAAAQSQSPLPIEVVRSARSPFGADVAESLAGGFTAQLDAVRRSVAVVLSSPGASATAEEVAATAAAMTAPIATEQVGITTADVNPASQFAPAMGVFFLYFVAALGARSLLAERRQGTLSRLLAAPVPGNHLLAGKAASTYLLGLLSMAVLVVASTFLLRTRWGPLLGVVAVVLAITFAVTAITALVLTLARTEQQTVALMSVVTFGMALLGGNFVSLAYAPAWLQLLSLCTPNGWALRAFDDMAAGEGVASAVVPVLAVTAFGLVAGGLAVARSDRLLRP